MLNLNVLCYLIVAIVVVICILLQGVPVKATLVMPEDLKTCKGEDLASISPDGQFPVLHYGDHKLSGSTDAIVDYIEESFKDPTLVPNSLKKVVRYWVAYIRDSFTPLVEELLHDGDPFLQVALESRLNDALEHLDSGIKVQQQHGNYFLGSEFTLVDVYLIPFLARMDFVTYIRGIGLTSYPRLLAYKSAMCTFKYYKPVQVGMDLCKDSVVKSFIEKPPQPIIHFTILQHRSIIRHLENFVQLVKGLESTNKQSMDTKKRTVLWVQLKELPKAFGRLLQLMQEHAQMEERVIFPLLETADPGINLLRVPPLFWCLIKVGSLFTVFVLERMYRLCVCHVACKLEEKIKSRLIVLSLNASKAL